MGRPFGVASGERSYWTLESRGTNPVGCSNSLAELISRATRVVVWYQSRQCAVKQEDGRINKITGDQKDGRLI